eukprot:650287-Rhodomonas_salina.1
MSATCLPHVRREVRLYQVSACASCVVLKAEIPVPVGPESAYSVRGAGEGAADVIHPQRYPPGTETPYQYPFSRTAAPMSGTARGVRWYECAVARGMELGVGGAWWYE